MQTQAFTSVPSIILLVLIGFLMPGCAIYYRDRETGAEHIWGFGHLSIKAIPPNEGKQALVQRMTLTGVAVGLDNGSLGISAGWDRREHILIYDKNAAITIQRHPSNDFYHFKIGTYPPDLGIVSTNENAHDTKEPKQ